MALRARLIAPPPPEREVWSYHQVKTASLPSHLLWSGERRMEAENYLASGYGIRQAIQEHKGHWVPLHDLARVWQPNRLKGIQVSPAFGTPFLAATQVFDLRPTPRKWLALEKTRDSINRFVAPGNILVTCSGAVGRTILATEALTSTLVSHDLLRIEPKINAQWGWLYAFLRSPQARAMMSSAQYGHIIKHLETSHLDALPVPLVDEDIATSFQKQVQESLDLRNMAYREQAEAEKLFAEAIGPLASCQSETGFSVKASTLTGKRRRFEGNFHAPFPASVLEAFQKVGKKLQPLSEVTDKVWWMARFKRFYGEAGIPYLSADELFAVNPVEGKRILVDPDDNHPDYFVQPGWIVMACSGQVYGLNGAASLMTDHHQQVFFSHDLIRITPKQGKIRPGYLITVLTHPVLGRPILIRNAYGTSIPHLDPGDVKAFPVVRLDSKVEGKIANFAEAASVHRALADALDRALAQEAATLIDRFIAGKPIRVQE